MKRFYELLAFTALLAVACQRVTEDSAAPQEPVAAPEAVQSQIQQVNMYLEESLANELDASLQAGEMTTKAEGFDSVMEQMQVVSIERLFPDAGEFEARHRAAGLHKWYVVSYQAEMPATKAVSSLADIPGVEVVRPRREIEIKATPFFNDPYYTNQWHYLNDGTTSGFVKGADVNALPVWNNITTGSSSVVVAVVDTGVDFAHEDLGSHVNLADSYNFVNGSPNIEPGDHGTHVGGTISAINNNGIGVSGIAGGDYAAGIKGTTLISCQVFAASGKGAGGHEQALVWAADHGAVIANNSWGYKYTDDEGNYKYEEAKRDFEFYLMPNEGAYKDEMKDAIDYFNTYAGMDKNGKQVGPMAGGLCLFSSGNDGTEYGVPACYPGAISVGAIGPNGRITSYSNYGEWVDIAAPGGNADSFGSKGEVLSTIPNNAYGYMQGTSMACPHVSGVAALVVAACGGQGFTRETLVEKLVNGTSSTVSLSGQNIGGLVDAWNAINYGDMTPPDKVTTFALSAKSNTITASWKVTGHEGIPAAGFSVLYSTSQQDLEASTPEKMSENVSYETYRVSSEKVGSSVSLDLKDLEFEATYYSKVYAFNSNLVYSEASSVVSAKTDKNNPPQITTDVDINNVRIKASETCSIFFSIVDPDGHEVKVEHTPGSAAESWRANPDGSYTLQIDAKKAQAGSYTSLIVVKDAYGATAQAQVKYTILENHAPVQKKSFDNQILRNPGESFTFVLSDYFADEDEDVITYSVSNTSESSVHVTANNGKLNGTAISAGLATVTVTAKDPLGKAVSAEFKVAVRTSDTPVTVSMNSSNNTIHITNNEANSVSMEIKVVSATGGVVFETTANASAFEPAVVDLSKAAPGLYSVIVTYSGNVYKQTVVKK